MEWYWIFLIVVAGAIAWILLSVLLYKQFFKRFYDVLLSGIAIVVLSPLFLIMIVIGSMVMRGNPFFTQERPGKNERVFKLIKFRSMDNRKDAKGNLLPDEKRLNKYGKFIRKASLDELPELLNIFIGDMSIVGPRPLLVEYLPWYTESERHRHDIRPGLTGWAQVNGRNSLNWSQRFAFDVVYAQNISIAFDIKVLFLTVLRVLKHDGVSEDTSKTEGNFAEIRKAEKEKTL